jgi:flagellar hook-basal body complex protein FliE
MDITTSYAGAMSAVSPGTFAPDMSPLVKAEPLPDDGTDTASAGAGAVTFKNALKDMLSNVNDQMVTAEQKSSDLALGKSNDLEGTVKSLEEAGLSMQMTMAVRNKLMDAYTEVNRMTF